VPLIRGDHAEQPLIYLCLRPNIARFNVPGGRIIFPYEFANYTCRTIASARRL